jgi:hypothetical protein
MTLDQQMQPASSGSATPGPDDRSQDFHAAQGEPQQYSGETLLVTAYCMLWVVLMVWIAIGWRKQSRIAQRLDDLERVIDKAAAAQDAGADAKPPAKKS